MRRDQFSRGIGLLSILGGGLVLLGWVLGSDALTSLLPGQSSMKANSAVCFVAVGVALLLRARGAHRVAGAPGLFVLVVGATTILEYLGHLNFGIDELVFVDPNRIQAGRMGLNTAICFSLIGMSLLLLRRPGKRWTLAAHTCVFGAIAIAFLALMGYVNDVKELYGPASYTAMALSTAILFLALSLALLVSASAYGLPATVLAPTPGGRMARRLLPVAGVPIVLHVLRTQANHAGFVSQDVGFWLVATLVVAALVAAVVLVAWVVDRAELSRELLATVVESSGEAIITLSADRVVTTWNRGAEHLYGWTAEEALGNTISSLALDAEPFEIELVQRAQAGEHADEYETTRQHRDGSRLVIAMSAWPLHDANGTLTGFASISRDIGERLATQRQLESLAARLQVSNAELEQFASVASHDLREPLRKIRSFGNLLTSRFAADLPDEGARYVERMSAAAERMETLIDGVLDLSLASRSGTCFEHVSLNRIAHEVLDDLHAPLTETGARVDVGDLPELDADALQMRQLLQNLIANALKFSRADTVPEITVRGRLDGAVIELTVSDNGIGFDDRHAERIFGPFQRLHGRTDYVGAGLGLALCRRIAERHGGSIVAHSTPGAGATFVTRIPVRQPMTEAA